MTLREKNSLIRELLHELDLHGPGERSHAERVAVYAVAIGSELGLDEEELTLLRYSAMLHDVGKVRVDARLLGKLGKLDESEFDTMRRHAELSLDILEQHEWLKPCLPAIIHHHERWDGLGYPTGLAKNLIPLGARIISVAEVFDVLTRGPRWMNRINEVEARTELEACSGLQFDPEVVQAFLKIESLIQPIED